MQRLEIGSVKIGKIHAHKINPPQTTPTKATPTRLMFYYDMTETEPMSLHVVWQCLQCEAPKID